MTSRESKARPWNSRLSAGGANRTNIRGQMRRIPELDGEISQRQSSSELIPVPRYSSFRQCSSRLLAAQRKFPEPYSNWQPDLPPFSHFQNGPSRRSTVNNDYRPGPPQRELSPDILLDYKGRPVPKKGMFLNAKYSGVVRPDVNERQIRKTEEMIRRIVHPQRQRTEPQQLYSHNNNLRDRIRQVVYDMGVPPEFRPTAPHYEPNEDEFRRSYKRREEASRQKYQTNSSEEEEEDDDGFYKSIKKRTREYSPEKTSRPTSRRDHSGSGHQKKKSGYEKEKHEKQEKPLEESSDEESQSLQKSFNVSRTSLSNNKTGAANTSHGSRNSSIVQVATPSPQYSKDPDEDDNWRNSLSYMSKPDCAGAAMFSRIGSAIPTIPLKDKTRNSYSKVAVMLLNKSIKEMNNPEGNPKKREKLQTQLMNMSTSWVRSVGSNGKNRDELARPGQTTIMNEISKIQNPQNATKVQIDESLFKNSLFFDRKGVDGSVRSQEKTMLSTFPSSVKSNEIHQHDEGSTAQSSIHNEELQHWSENDSEEDDEPSAKQMDIDDYIAQGASKISFSRTPQMCSSSTGNENNYRNSTQEDSNEMNQKHSKQSADRSLQMTSEENKVQSSSKEKTVSTSTLHLNSRFLFSTSRKQKSSKQPMLDIDEDTQKMFDDVFNDETNESVRGEEERRQKNKKKYSF